MKRVTLPSGIAIETLDEGPRDAPVLLFLHGFPESHRTWRHQVPYFAERFRCIVPDQRGYRGSSKPQDVSSYEPGKLIGDVFQLAEALGVEDFTVVGHDWGGAIAWGVALAGQASGKVTRAVIANAPHPAIFQRLLYTDPVQRAASQYMREFRDTANDALVREHGLGGILARAVRWERSERLERAEREALATDWQNREAAFGMLNWYRASPVVVPTLDEPYGLPDNWREPPLPPLTIPTLVIWAMDDLALPACNIEGMEAIIPNLTLCPVHGCGHFVPWEAPEVVNQAMDAFLAST